MGEVRRPKVSRRSEFGFSFKVGMTSASLDCQTGDGKGYKGEVDKTVSGKDCQDWAEQSPHKHKFEEVGEHNFCRNPDNHTMVWCYTTDKKKRWEKCDVPQC